MHEHQREAGASAAIVKKWVRIPNGSDAHRLIEGQAAALRQGANPANLMVLPAPLTGGTSADLATILTAIQTLERKINAVGKMLNAMRSQSGSIPEASAES